VQVRYQTVAGGAETRAHTKNIGVGGAFILAARPPVIGTRLRLIIEMPGAAPMEVRAEVRWLSRKETESGMGVRFAGLEVDQLLELNEYFATLTSTVDHDGHDDDDHG
jgi:uncharacterized protein (TIGR02266 family)